MCGSACVWAVIKCGPDGRPPSHFLSAPVGSGCFVCLELVLSDALTAEIDLQAKKLVKAEARVATLRKKLSNSANNPKVPREVHAKQQASLDRALEEKASIQNLADQLRGAAGLEVQN
mmetsp:Transcript_3088/g.5837  ORF Transcript_3088/g.5837 Transcript_3088/m.5837 type:complete len:118 (-) Transcript_3088:192-545(-)